MKKSILSALCILSFLMTTIYYPVYATDRKPYSKNVLPGYIISGNFDEGDEGVTYSPLNVKKTGNYSYRPGYELNFWKSALRGGVAMSFNAKEWLEYTVSVSESGEYEVSVSYATPAAAQFILYVDGAQAFSSLLESTGSFTTSDESVAGIVKMTAGNHIIRVEMGSGGMNYNYMNFVNLSSAGSELTKTDGCYRFNVIPSIIEAEDYDLGSNGCYSKTNKNQGKKYRRDDPMDIYESNGKYFVRYAKGEYTVYTFNAEESGAYDFYAAALTQGNLEIYIDDSAMPVKADVGNKDALFSIWLDKGQHKIKCVCDSAADIDYYRFINSSSQSYLRLSDLEEKQVEVKNEEQSEKIYRQFYISPNGSDENDGSEETPFKSLQKAREEVKEISSVMNGDIIVNIMPGYYYFDKTITFDDTDSGKNGYDIIYKGCNALETPVFGGGIRISGWQKQENGIYKAYAGDISDLRNLYINDLPAKRARSKYSYVQSGDYDASDIVGDVNGLVIQKNNFPKLIKPKYSEFVWNLYWTSQRTPVQSITEDSNNFNVVFKPEAWERAINKSNETTSPSGAESFYIENDLSLLDEQGEFYFDRDTKEVYYFPFEEENMETAQIYGACTEYLMKLEGQNNKNTINHVKFNNIAFKYSDWLEVSDYGISQEQADALYNGHTGMRGARMLPAQIQVNNAKNLSFENCRFACLGSGAISMVNSVSDCKIIGNVFTDIGGSTIIVGSYDHVLTMPEGVDRTTNVEIANNVIRRAASNFNGCCGISVYYVNGVNVHHNDIMDLPYTGITMGWGWEAEDITTTGNNNIDYNRIVDVMQTLHDGGHIYTLGPLRNTTITGNYCEHCEDASGSIYLDQGSAYIAVNDNVVINSRYWLNARPNVNIRGVSASGNYTDNKQTNLDPGVKISDTTVFDSKNIPEGARSIIDGAGLQQNYKNLLKDVEYPDWRTDFIYTVPKNLYGGPCPWIEAEDYMDGGNEVGFHKTDSTTQVVVFKQGVRSAVGNTAAGEWLKYKIDVEESKDYRLDIQYSNAFDETTNKSLTRVYIDDNVVIDSAPCPNTGSWSDYSIAQLGKFFISKGTHTIKIEFVDNAYSFDCWRLYDEDISITDGNDPYFDEGKITFIKKKKSFEDMKGHWAEETVTRLCDMGIVNGVSDKLFEPQSPVTLYQATWLIMRVLKIPYNDENWKTVAYSYGLLESEDEKDKVITRERFVFDVCKAYLDMADEYSMNYFKEPFNDTKNISLLYYDNVLNAYGLGLIHGDNNKNFNPKSSLSRAEASTVIYNLYNIVR